MARALAVTGTRTRELDQGWSLAEARPGQVTDVGALDAAALQWTAALVPGTAASSLRATGGWDFDSPRRFDGSDWWYRCPFAWDTAEGAPSVVLRLAGLATVADVWLNGTHLVRSENMFVAHSLEVAPLLRERNDLVVRFHALEPLLAVRRPRPRWRTRLVERQNLRFFRTTLLGRMPGWTPPVPAVGPWRPITLEASSLLVVEEARAQAALQGTEGRVGTQITLRALGAGAPTAAVLRVGSAQGPLACTPTGEAWTLSGELRVPGVEPWFPHTHGEQPRYPVHVDLQLGSERVTIVVGQVGFRQVTLDRGPDGEGFALQVNGLDVFCRGACWTPLDVVSLGATRDEYRAALVLARDAGMNMLRVAGTMAYEADAFHDLCDELGILVWQELMFANLDYPTDEAFAASVRTETLQLLDRLQLRPSLAVLCGNSEVEQQIAMLGRPREEWRDPLFHDVLAGLCREGREDVPYWPSSPGGGPLPFSVSAGVSHYYGVGAYRRPLEDARRAGVRFAAECLAFSNVPQPATLDECFTPEETVSHHPRWKTRVPRDPGAGWDFEDVRDHYLALLFGVEAVGLRGSDPERYLALSRVVTAEVMAATFSEWRRPGSSCRGALVWLLRDLWPGAGWGLIDARGRPKAAYHALRRVLAPVALLVTDEGLDGLRLHALNEGPHPLAAVLHVEVLRNGETPVAIASHPLLVPARGGTSLAAETLFPAFLDLTYAYRFGPPGHDVVVARLEDAATGRILAEAFHFPLGRSSAQVEHLGLEARAESTGDGTHTLRLRTRQLALSVAIDAPGFVPEDNHFHLAPGRERVIRLIADGRGPAPPLRGRVHPLNARRATTFLGGS